MHKHKTHKRETETNQYYMYIQQASILPPGLGSNMKELRVKGLGMATDPVMSLSVTD